jgi:hypothetical protein
MNALATASKEPEYIDERFAQRSMSTSSTAPALVMCRRGTILRGTMGLSRYQPGNGTTTIASQFHDERVTSFGSLARDLCERNGGRHSRLIAYDAGRVTFASEVFGEVDMPGAEAVHAAVTQADFYFA